MHHWNDDEREIIRRDYCQTHASRREIGARLGVSEYAVAGQIGKMGIAKQTDRHPWTPAQDELLCDLIHRYCPSSVAKKMRRSVNSVVVRAKRLGHHRRIRDGWFTKREACEILGVDHKRLQKRIDAGQLKASWHNGHDPELSSGGSACWHINEADLVAFIRRYPQDLTARNVITIVDLLAGLETIERGRSNRWVELGDAIEDAMKPKEQDADAGAAGSFTEVVARPTERH